MLARATNHAHRKIDAERWLLLSEMFHVVDCAREQYCESFICDHSDADQSEGARTCKGCCCREIITFSENALQ